MSYKNQILADVETKFKTTMIGALARFEESFGHLWEEEGPDQQEYIELWEYTRNAILNNGNKQMRAALDDLTGVLLNQYKTKYTYKFHNRNQGDDQ
jgi:hypothetical protein